MSDSMLVATPATPTEHSRAPQHRPVILQIIPRLDTGGAERTTIDIARAATRAGYRALVVCEGGHLVEELRETGAEWIAMEVASKNPMVMWRNRTRLANLIRERNISLVHARSRGPAWSAYFAAKKMRVPFVTTYHGIYNAGNALKRYYNSIMARADMVIANSAWTARHIEAEHGAIKDRLVVIPRGIDLEYFNPNLALTRVVAMRARWGTAEKTRVVLLPGRLTRWKGQHVLIAALAQMAREGRLPTDVRVVFGGDAQGRLDYARGLKAASLNAGLQDIVVFTGHITDMPAAYASADVVVSASTDPEAFGRVPVEAGAMQRVVIATAHGGAEETILPGETGVLVPPGDVGALAAALATTLSRPKEQLSAMGVKARAHVTAHYSVDRMCEETLRVYARLLRQQGSQA